ncbi:MAG: hypothetical protein ALAOOOJD_04432 [bacterium]|nr:hypothetical protein [bacterium]
MRGKPINGRDNFLKPISRTSLTRRKRAACASFSPLSSATCAICRRLCRCIQRRRIVPFMNENWIVAGSCWLPEILPGRWRFMTLCSMLTRRQPGFITKKGKRWKRWEISTARKPHTKKPAIWMVCVFAPAVILIWRSKKWRKKPARCWSIWKMLSSKLRRTV